MKNNRFFDSIRAVERVLWNIHVVAVHFCGFTAGCGRGHGCSSISVSAAFLVQFEPVYVERGGVSLAAFPARPLLCTSFRNVVASIASEAHCVFLQERLPFFNGLLDEALAVIQIVGFATERAGSAVRIPLAM